MDTLTRTAREVVAGPFESKVQLQVDAHVLTIERRGLSRLLAMPTPVSLPLEELELQELDLVGGRLSLCHQHHAVRLSGSGAGTILALLRASDGPTDASRLPLHFRTQSDGVLGGEGDLFIGPGGISFAPRTDTATMQAVYHREPWALVAAHTQRSQLVLRSESVVSFSLPDPTEALDTLAIELARVPRTDGTASTDSVPFSPNLVRPVVWHLPGQSARRAWLYAGRDGLFVHSSDGSQLHVDATGVQFLDRQPDDEQRCTAVVTIDKIEHRFLPLFLEDDLHRSLEAVLCARVFDGVSTALGMAWRPVEVPWTTALLEQEATSLSLEVKGCFLAAQASVASQDGVLLMGLTNSSPFLQGTTITVTLARSRSRLTFRAQVAGGGRLDARTSRLGVGRVGQPYLSLRPLQPGPTPLANRRDFLRVALADIDAPNQTPRRPALGLPSGKRIQAQLLDASGQGVGLLVAGTVSLTPGQTVTLHGLQEIIGAAPDTLFGHVSHVQPTSSGLLSVGVRFDGLHTRDIDRIHADVLKLQVLKRRSSGATETRSSS